MGRTRKLLGLTALGAIVLPPLAASIVRSRHEDSPADADDLRFASIYDGRRLAASSQSLRRGEAIAWYGALALDLRGARLDPAGATLRVVALFSGARVLVPPGWDVRVRPVSIMGGVDAWTEPPIGPGPAPRLTIEAIAVFSGIEVTDRPTDAELDISLGPPGTEGPAPVSPAAAADTSSIAFERAEAEARREAEANDDRSGSAAPDEGMA